MANPIPNLNKFLPFIAILVVLISPVSASTTVFWSDYFNQESVSDPGGVDYVHYNSSLRLADAVAPNTTPWEMFWASGIVGIGLIVLSIFLTMRTGIGIPELERGIIFAIMSWVPLGYCSFAAFNIDRITGYGVASNIVNQTTKETAFIYNHEYVYMEQHLIYSEPLIGIIFLVCGLFAVGFTLYLISSHRTLRGEVKQERVND